MKSPHFELVSLSMIGAAVAAALGIAAPNVQAAAVTGLTIRDVGSNTANAAGNYSPVLDGRSGAFRLTSPASFLGPTIDLTSYAGTSLFTGDVGTGTLLGNGAANPAGSFSTGFQWIYDPMIPFTYGSNFNADITGGMLSVVSLDFGSNGAHTVDFLFPPDAGALEVLWVIPTANTSDWDVAFRWAHVITTAEDPSLSFTGFTGLWVLEGCASTVGHAGAACGATVPVPAAAWLLGTGTVGLIGLANRARRRSSRRNDKA